MRSYTSAVGRTLYFGSQGRHRHRHSARGGGIGGRDRNQSPPGPTRTLTGVGVDAEAGSPDDMLAVYFVDASGKLNGPIWEHSLKGGLNASALPLFERIKHEVETAYP
jgi:hypothetical protein